MNYATLFEQGLKNLKVESNYSSTNAMCNSAQIILTTKLSSKEKDKN